jgi:hypothetical protein
VILLENFNEWNLSLARRRTLKEREDKEKREKRGARIEKRKRGETSVEKLRISKMKRKRGQDRQAIGRDSIKRKKEDHIFL